MLKKGTKIKTISNEYIIRNQIGQGGNGTVFLACDDSGKEYGVKAIDRTRTSKEKLKRFHNEIAFCSNNSHENIVPIIDRGTYYNDSKDLVFYIMPFYPSTLRDLMKSGIPHERVLPLFLDIASGLCFAHQKGVWHRDIKPENILIDADGHAIIADFGIAHFCEDEMATLVETNKHDRMANFQYAAPEQRIRGQMVDGRADVYSIGLILNEMFTGTIIYGVNYQTIASVNKDYGYLDEVVSKLICQYPEERLYPVDKIAIEILALQKKAENTKALLKLASEQPVEDLEEEIIQPPRIIDISYEDGYLKLKLQGLPPRHDIWFSFLTDGKYSYSSIADYAPYRLHFIEEDTIAMPVRAERADVLKQLVGMINSWFHPATRQYNQQVLSKRLQKRLQNRNDDEKTINEEAQRLRIDNELKDLLRELQ